MSEDILEEWMHATDEERADIHAKWDVASGEGLEIAQAVAELFKGECIYGVQSVDVVNSGGSYVINAYMNESDYENVKGRYNVEFLGFKINFDDVKNR